MATGLDYLGPNPGYHPSSAWPVECGGNRRQKLVPTPGLALAAGERLASTTRHSGGWAVMFITREPGELYLQCGAGMRPGQLPPQRRPDGDNHGWIERVDPTTLKTLRRSPPLPSGGHLWCGAAVAHENGDIYCVNGRFCHRLSPDCEVVAERELPYDGVPPHPPPRRCCAGAPLRPARHDDTMRRAQARTMASWCFRTATWS